MTFRHFREIFSLDKEKNYSKRIKSWGLAPYPTRALPSTRKGNSSPLTPIFYEESKIFNVVYYIMFLYFYTFISIIIYFYLSVNSNILQFSFLLQKIPLMLRKNMLKYEY